jgi:hemerythrin-like domain-containing protein
VEADHGVEAKRLRSFARAVDYILADQEFLRESLHLAVHDFIEHQRQHLEKEERLLFPAAVKALRCGGSRRLRKSANDGDWDLAARGRTIYRFVK